MNWPPNPLSYLLRAAYTVAVIKTVIVEVHGIDPLRLRLIVRADRVGDVPCDLVLIGCTIDQVDAWTTEVAWATGSADLCRWTSGGRDDSPLYVWTWVPVYGRQASACFPVWLQQDPSLEQDGGRWETYPDYEPQTLMDAARIFPPHGSGMDRVTQFLFRSKQ